MARQRGATGRGIETVQINLRIDKQLRDELWSKVARPTLFIENAIREKLDRDGLQLWARREQEKLITGLD